MGREDGWHKRGMTRWIGAIRCGLPPCLSRLSRVYTTSQEYRILQDYFQDPACDVICDTILDLKTRKENPWFVKSASRSQVPSGNWHPVFSLSYEFERFVILER